MQHNEEITSSDHVKVKALINESDFNFSICLSFVSSPLPIGGLDATLVSGKEMELNDPLVWWLNRLMVKEQYRGLKLGSYMIERLKKAAKKHSIYVEPGGYGADPIRRKAFYIKHGFHPLRASEALLYTQQ